MEWMFKWVLGTDFFILRLVSIVVRDSKVFVVEAEPLQVVDLIGSDSKVQVEHLFAL